MDGAKATVKIGGVEYTISGSGESEEYIHRVAIAVDRKFRELMQKYPGVSPDIISVLTAVNIADENIKLTDEINDLKKVAAELSAENVRLRKSLGK